MSGVAKNSRAQMLLYQKICTISIVFWAKNAVLLFLRNVYLAKTCFDYLCLFFGYFFFRPISISTIFKVESSARVYS
jgi:hypothetical protein